MIEENYEEIWVDICFDIQDHKYDEEAKFQIVAENIFGKLGWSKRLGEITKPTVSVGSKKGIIPDIVIKKEDENVFVVELKRIGIDLSDENVAQLKSYMRLLRLRFGILIGKSIQVFYESNEEKDIVKICEADFQDDDVLGPQIIKLLSKKEYEEERFERFCKDQIKISTEERKIREDVDFLCSEKGKEYIKELLLIEYSDEVINRLNITIREISNSIGPIKPGPEIPEDLSRKGGEIIQEWIKRILPRLYREYRKISQTEINDMHKKEYSKRTFGIAYPLLCDSEEEIYDRTGKARYWKNWKLDNKYYVCSQWWKTEEHDYQKKINAWLERLFKINLVDSVAKNDL